MSGGANARPPMMAKSHPPVLSFGFHLPLGGWVEDKASGRWQRLVPEVAAGQFYPRQMWLRGGAPARLTRARTPNNNKFFTIPLDGALPAPNTAQGFRYRDGDLNGKHWSELDDVEIVVYASWTNGRHYIKELNTTAPELMVLFTSPCGFEPAGNWPNSGNRYYIENSVEMVDEEGEWHISRTTGLLTYFPIAGTDPNKQQFILDRGESLREGLLVKNAAPQTTILVAPDVRSRTAVVLPPETVSWGASSFSLHATIQTNSTRSGQTIFFKGPRSHEHVPQDKRLYIDSGHLALDIGWEGHLEGNAGAPGRRHRRQVRTLTAVPNIADGRVHSVELMYDEPSSTYTFVIDGHKDTSAGFGSADKSPSDWIIEVASNWSADGFVSNVTYSFYETTPVRQLHLEGLQVQHVGWGLGREDVTDFQAVSYLRTAALHLVDAHACSLTDMNVEHVGGFGIWVEGGSDGVSIQNCNVFDVGAGGLRVGRGTPLSDEPPNHRTADVSVNNSRFANGSKVYAAGNGVLLQNSPRFTLTHSEVAFFDHVGVTLGWVWGATLPPMTEQNVVEYNHVHHVGNGHLSDLGGIYALGAQPGTRIRYNLVHDSKPYFMYGHGIYFDEGTSGVLCEKNWVHSSFSALFMQHYGVNNTIRNNVFARTTGNCLSFDTLGTGQQTHCAGYLWSPNYRGHPCEFSFYSNVVAMSGPQGWVHQGAEGRCNASYRRNLYHNASGPVTATFTGVDTDTFPGYPGAHLNFRSVNATWSEWQASGQDTNSIEADALFEAPDPVQANDFRLRANSPALGLGFENFDLRGSVGPDWSRPSFRTSSLGFTESAFLV